MTPPVSQGPAGQYGYPGSGYGAGYGAGYGPGYGPKPPRETGALVVCVVLLVLAIAAAFIGSAAAFSSVTDDASGSVPPVQGSYAPGGTGEQGSSGIGGAGGGVPNGSTSSSTTTDPEAQGKRLIRDFPLYPGARHVASPKKYLPRGAFVSKYGKKYVVDRAPNTVYNWYIKHLSRDHLAYFDTPSLIRSSTSGKVIDSYGTITSPLVQSVSGNFDIELGRQRGVSVLTVTLYA